MTAPYAKGLDAGLLERGIAPKNDRIHGAIDIVRRAQEGYEGLRATERGNAAVRKIGYGRIRARVRALAGGRRAAWAFGWRAR